MNETQQNVQYKEDEIDLRELILVFWKKKIMIISFALIGAILSGLFSVFIMTPVYDTDLKIDLNIPETYTTKYGEYKLPNSTNGQYFELIMSNDVLANTIKDMGYKEEVTLKSIKDRISIEKVDTKIATQNVFDVKVSGSSPEESLKLAKTLYDNYIEYVDMLTKDRAVSYYYENFSATLEGQEILLKSTKEILQKNREILIKTPETINQRELNNTGNTVIENIINPAYQKLQEGIVANEQLIITTEDNIRTYKENLDQLDKEKKAISKYYETGVSEGLNAGIVNIAETSIDLLATPVAPTQKTSPSNARNAAIGLILGGMLACGIALIREYWFKKA